MIKVIKDNDKWLVVEPTTGISAEVVTIHSYNPLGLQEKKLYRVDFRGKTVASMLDNFQRAKGIAFKCVKGAIEK